MRIIAKNEKEKEDIITASLEVHGSSVIVENLKKANKFLKKNKKRKIKILLDGKKVVRDGMWCLDMSNPALNAFAHFFVEPDNIEVEESYVDPDQLSMDFPEDEDEIITDNDESCYCNCDCKNN